MQEYYYFIGQNKYDPCNGAQIRELVSSGVITRKTIIDINGSPVLAEQITNLPFRDEIPTVQVSDSPQVSKVEISHPALDHPVWTFIKCKILYGMIQFGLKIFILFLILALIAGSILIYARYF